MAAFDPECRRCPRLSEFLDSVKRQYPDYFCRPVPPFGEADAQLLIVGLAPGMHGANQTGRPFTGDYAGILLYETLHRFGFSTAPESLAADDGLQLLNARISNAVKCLPPDNKPVGSEVNNCNVYLASEISAMDAGSVIIALGGIAHKAVVKALGMRQADFKFGHLAEHRLGSLRLIDSYHCSRYNTNTRRLTPEMFAAVFDTARRYLDAGRA